MAFDWIWKIKIMFSRSEMKLLMKEHIWLIQIREGLIDILRADETLMKHYGLDFKQDAIEHTKQQIKYYEERIQRIEEIMKKEAEKKK